MHRAIRSGDFHTFLLAGGRGSLKSSFASMEMLLLMMEHPDIHGVVLRKVEKTLRRSVFAQYQWAAEMLGLGEQVRFTVSPMEMEYLPTGQRLLFLGAEDPGALKSLKPPFGYFGLIHFEEWDQFGGEKETRSIRQSARRVSWFSFIKKPWKASRERRTASSTAATEVMVRLRKMRFSIAGLRQRSTSL